MDSVPERPETSSSEQLPGGGAPIRILLCDHRGEGLEQIFASLEDPGVELVVSRSPRETRLRMRHSPPTLVVLDPLSMGGVVELEEIEELRSGQGPIPVLLVCDTRAPASTLQAAKVLGAKSWDLVYRSAPLEEYLLRIERLRISADALDELEEMRYRAAHDDRTELLRPRFFQSRLGEHFSASRRHRLGLALVICDLDNFGQVNKRFDHTVGDEVITLVGRAIRRHLRAEDVAGRLGGDEFAVILPYTAPVDAAWAVNRLRDAIHSLSGRVGDAGQDLVISASIGFETTDGAEIESVSALRDHAEKALRCAKRMGGNRGVYYRNLPREQR